MSITLRSIASSAAGSVCEDSHGHVGTPQFGAAWVLDGATGLGDHEYIPGAYSDAAWYAAQFSAALQKFSLEPVPAEKIFLSAIRMVAQAWYETVGDAPIPRYCLPSAAGIWVRWKDDTLESVSLGDCRGWYHSPDGTMTQLGLMDEDPNDEWLAKIVTQHQANGVAPQDMRKMVLNDIRIRRELMNTDKGYWILSLHDETVQKLKPHAWQVSGGTIVLCSDGLFRWSDVLQQGGAAEFVKTCTANLGGALTRVRELETKDVNCKLYPRLRRHDDATGLVLTVEKS